MKKIKVQRVISFALAIVVTLTLLTSVSLAAASDNNITKIGADFTGVEMPETQGNKFIVAITPPATDSIQISSREDLEKIGNHPDYPLSGTYHLTTDIDLFEAGEKEWESIGGNFSGINSAASFTGVFDGQGHMIKNLKITGNQVNAGLFSGLWDATVKNIGIEETYIDISSDFTVYAGGICGYAVGSSRISNCYNTGEISAASLLDTAYAGGICGYIRPQSSNSDPIVITVRDCYNIGKIYAETSARSVNFATYCANAGGIFGEIEVLSSITAEVTINVGNCYNTGDVSAYSSVYYPAYAGGICAQNKGQIYEKNIAVSISNCYNTGNISCASDSGPGTGAGAYTGGICAAVSYNRHINSVDDTAPVITFSNCYNEGSVSVSNSKGTAQASGICQSAISQTFVKSNVNISNCYNTGNIEVSDCLNASSAGGISSSIYGGASVSNCHNTGNISARSAEANGGAASAGGITGDYSSQINIGSCYNTGDIYAFSFMQYALAGGICGGNKVFLINNITITNCYNEGTASAVSSAPGNSIYSYAYAGGIISSAAYNSTPITPPVITLTDCHNTGDISARALGLAYAGGIVNITGSVGNITVNIDNCYNTSKVTASSEKSDAFAGGIVGTIQNYRTAFAIKNCYNTGVVYACAATSTAYAGGIGGHTSNNINLTENDRNIIRNCRNTGNITAEGIYSAYAGGISGIIHEYIHIDANSFSLAVENCNNTGKISALSGDSESNNGNSFAYAGGIFGEVIGHLDSYYYMTLTITVINCYNTGAIDACGGSVWAGGIFGRFDCAITSGGLFDINVGGCYNSGTVSAVSDSNSVYSGGIFGYFGSLSDIKIKGELDLTVSDCYNISNITADSSAVYNFYNVISANAGGIFGCVNEAAVNNQTASLPLTVSNCYNIGGVSASIAADEYDANAGAVLGYIFRKNSDTYYTSGVSIILDNCYWNTDINTTGVGKFSHEDMYGIDTAKSLTTAQMQTQFSFVGFDFENVWAINPDVNNGFPYFKDMKTSEPELSLEAVIDEIDGLTIIDSDFVESIAGIKFDKIKEKLDGAKIYKDGKDITNENPKLGTGMILKNDNEEITVVIKGDVTGNGNPDIGDAHTFLEHLVGNKPLTGAYEKAADDFAEDSAIKSLRAFLNFVMNLQQESGN